MSDAVLNRFLRCYLEDQRNGGARELVDYVRRFPGHDAEIAREYQRLGEPAIAESAFQRRIGRYRVTRELGRGGQGTVFLAKDPILGRDVALKVLNKLGRLSPRARRRMRREGAVLARLDHPGLCGVLEIGEHEDCPFLALQYVDAPALSEVLDGEAVAWRQVVVWMEAVARALHVAHEAGVVHRDLKPQNILISNRGPVVVDFGLALEPDSPTVTVAGDIFGTPSYLAPEQVRLGSHASDARSDVYSLGAILYLGVTGHLPVDAPTREALLRAISLGQCVRARVRCPELPREVETVIEKAMALEPHDRYASALELAQDLGRLSSGEPVAARRPSLSRRARWWVRQHAHASVALLAVLVATVVMVSMAAGTRATERRTRAILQDFDLVALEVDVASAFASEAALVPAWPERAAGLRAWLDQYALLGEKLELVESRLREARHAFAEGHLGRMRSRYLRQQLVDLRDELDRFVRQAVPSVRARLRWAETIHQESIADHREAWDAAVSEIERHPAYGSLQIRPQVGLVPLGPDPHSGLWEFAHLASGEPPVRDPGDGQLVLSDEAGLVFVLLPAGVSNIGAQRTDPADLHYDPAALPREGPVTAVELDPYFVSKYEKTRAQWVTLGGELRQEQKALMPAARLSWYEAAEVLRIHGLRLPTEAQWEYAARGGTGSPWWSGTMVQSLAGVANVRDEAARAKRTHLNPGTMPYDLGLFDGYANVAPVHMLRPNRFGLHHVHGNVREWCRDGGLFSYSSGFAPGDGLLSGSEQGRALRVARGGESSKPATQARSSYREHFEATVRGRIGIRAVRELFP